MTGPSDIVARVAPAGPAGDGGRFYSERMKVFISSVTYQLSEERQALKRLLQVVPPYEPLLFEDFTARNLAPRDACLAGVDECDVYVLLLGPRYGQPLPDSGLAPTEEEFTRARRSNKPILVFVKDSDETDEPSQRAFKDRVEGYVDGRFRDSFDGPVSLNEKVMAALAGLEQERQPLRWSSAPAGTVVAWLQDQRRIQLPAYVPVLSLSLLPVESGLMPSALGRQTQELGRTGRQQMFFDDRDGLTIDSDGTTGWAYAPESDRGRASFGNRNQHTFRGATISTTGQVTVFAALPTDMLGALVDQPSLASTLLELATFAARFLPSSGEVAVGAELGPLDNVVVGDPEEVGRRNSGTASMSRGLWARMEPAHTVPVDAVGSHAAEVASEAAVSLLTAMHSSNRW